MSRKPVRVLFVCLGNICRSPTAEGVFTHIVEQENESDWIEIDSAGTHAYHVGSSPDHRARKAAKNRGINLDQLRGRQAIVDDFDEFDYILAMDDENYENLLLIAPHDKQHKVKMFLSYSDNFDETEVPDPYYGGDRGFEHVLDLVEDASRGLLNHLRENH